ncbi:MAG: sugar phosphate nucleotidyltransferase [Polyangiales bacterium]
MGAMVLAAGLGTRLRPLTHERPKPAVPVANRPLAWFALDHLARAGVREVVLNTHYLGERLPDLLAPYLPADLTPTYLHEPDLLGTGGGVHNARDHLLAGEHDPDAPVLLTNSDILFAPDYAAALATHRRHGAIATMVLRPDPEAARYGAVEVDPQGRVRRLLGAPQSAPEPLEALMFTGVHVLSPRAFEDLPAQGCIIRHSYRRWVDEGVAVAGHVDTSPWRDLGTLEAYLQANLDLADGTLRWPGITPDPATGTLVDPTADVPLTATLRHAVVGPGARIAPHVTLERAVVWPDAEVTEDARGAVITPTQRVSVE